MDKDDQKFWEQCAIVTVQGFITAGYDKGGTSTYQQVAFDVADAMLAERNKRLEAMKPKDAEWTAYAGKGAPISLTPTTRVEVRTAGNPYIQYGLAGQFLWDDRSITAYRVVEDV